MDFILPFITGLTTGGLSCLAVQGGLLAGSVAHEVEQSLRNAPGVSPARGSVRGHARRDARPASSAQARQNAGKAAGRGARTLVAGLPQAAQAPAQPRAAQPIALFLAAKIVAYTLLGFLLGALGSVLQLSTTTRALLQAGIGIFMVGTALRMFDVHPIFRYFALEPPRFVTRYIRRRAKDQAGAVTPLFLGALTVLIPCGVTQAMMAVAMGTGSAAAGAVTMFAFTLGTSPVFFAIAYLATRLGRRLEANFMRAVAVVVLVLGLVSVDAGLTLGGWPYSFSNLRLAWSTARAEAAPTGDEGQSSAASSAAQGANGQSGLASFAAPNGSASQQSSSLASGGSTSASSVQSANVVTIKVAGNGYSPRVSHAKANRPLRMALVTKNTGGCARAFVIPSLRVQKILPPTGTTMIDVPAQKPGSRLYYSCSMGMYSGVIVFDS